MAIGTASVLNGMKFTFYWSISSFFFALSCRKITIILSAPPRIDDIERAADPCRRRLALKIMINGGNKFMAIINWFRVSMGSTTEKSIIWSPWYGVRHLWLWLSPVKWFPSSEMSGDVNHRRSHIECSLYIFNLIQRSPPLKRLISRNQQNAKLDVNEFILQPTRCVGFRHFQAQIKIRIVVYVWIGVRKIFCCLIEARLGL